MHSLSPAVNPLVEQVLATGKYTDPNALLLDARGHGAKLSPMSARGMTCRGRS
jgi:hypothetical protein